jgi:DNA-binding HxlR family transcriptional regulator
MLETFIISAIYVGSPFGGLLMEKKGFTNQSVKTIQRRKSFSHLRYYEKHNSEFFEKRHALVEALDTLGNHGRLLILDELKRGKKTFDDIRFATKLNPKSITDHLKKLMDQKMILKSKPGYEITDKGRILTKYAVEELENKIYNVIQKTDESGSMIHQVEEPPEEAPVEAQM